MEIKNILRNQWEKEKAAWHRLRRFSWWHKPLKNASGIAMMIAIAALMLIMWLAMELSYESNVEYTVNSQNLNRIKAYYAAKSGLDVALLRIKIFQKISSQFGEQLGSNSAMLDEIWRFPFAWPLPIPDELNAVDKDTMKSTVKDAFMDAAFMTTIEDEGSKIDLNDLASKSKVIRQNAKKQLMNIFETQRKQDEEFDRKYGATNFEALINQISDFISENVESAGGGDKKSAFAEINSEAQSEMFPPNRAFRSLAELRFIPLMTDDLYELLEPRITIYGMKGINPNLAPKEVILSLDPGLTSEVVDELIKRRTDQNLGGPYQNAEDFWNYAQTKGARIEGDVSQIPLVFDAITNFKIRSSGEFAGAAREITAIVMDIDRIAIKVAEQVKKEEKEAQQGSGSSGFSGSSDSFGARPTSPAKQSQSQKRKPTIPKGPPRIVWWNEK